MKKTKSIQQLVLRPIISINNERGYVIILSDSSFSFAHSQEFFCIQSYFCSIRRSWRINVCKSGVFGVRVSKDDFLLIEDAFEFALGWARRRLLALAKAQGLSSIDKTLEVEKRKPTPAMKRAGRLRRKQ